MPRRYRTGPLLAALSAAVCLSGVWLARAAADTSATRPPNFILILTDDQGYQDLGAFGSEKIRTPNLDRMAREGIRLTSFYAQAVCGRAGRR